MIINQISKHLVLTTIVQLGKVRGAGVLFISVTTQINPKGQEIDILNGLERESESDCNFFISKKNVTAYIQKNTKRK
jgi:hypothetical protein